MGQNFLAQLKIIRLKFEFSTKRFANQDIWIPLTSFHPELLEVKTTRRQDDKTTRRLAARLQIPRDSSSPWLKLRAPSGPELRDLESRSLEKKA